MTDMFSVRPAVVSFKYQPVVGSREIAEVLSMEHGEVLRYMRRAVSDGALHAGNYLISYYEDSQYKRRTEWFLDSKSAIIMISLLARDPAVTAMVIRECAE